MSQRTLGAVELLLRLSYPQGPSRELAVGQHHPGHALAQAQAVVLATVLRVDVRHVGQVDAG